VIASTLVDSHEPSLNEGGKDTDSEEASPSSSKRLETGTKSVYCWKSGSVYEAKTGVTPSEKLLKCTMWLGQGSRRSLGTLISGFPRLTGSDLTAGDHERLDGDEVSPQPRRSQLGKICERQQVS